MGQRIQRHLGMPKSLEPGQFCITISESMSGHRSHIYLCCPTCGVNNVLDDEYAVDVRSGKVTPEYVCPRGSCSFKDWLTLESM